MVPNFTPVTPLKLVPVMVVEVPPVVGPVVVESEVTVGGDVVGGVLAVEQHPHRRGGAGRRLGGGGRHGGRDVGVVGERCCHRRHP